MGPGQWKKSAGISPDAMAKRQIRLNLRGDNVRLVDYVDDPGERKANGLRGWCERFEWRGRHFRSRNRAVLAGCISSTVSHESGII
jgi:hypothetical protein